MKILKEKLEILKEPIMNWCNYCECIDCKNGTWDKSMRVRHAKTENTDYICSICYTYDLCADKGGTPQKGKCADGTCGHKPKLIGEWHE